MNQRIHWRRPAMLGIVLATAFGLGCSDDPDPQTAYTFRAGVEAGERFTMRLVEPIEVDDDWAAAHPAAILGHDAYNWENQPLHVAVDAGGVLTLELFVAPLNDEPIDANGPTPQPHVPTAAADTPDHTEAENPRMADPATYRGLRQRVLALEPAHLGMPADTERPLAVLMEMGMGDAVATVVAVADGTTSLYLSNGSGFIGAGEYDAVRRVTLAFIELAQANFDRLNPSPFADPPQAEQVSFHVVTARGLFTATVPEGELSSADHPLAPLYRKGHEVLTQIRLHSTR